MGNFFKNILKKRNKYIVSYVRVLENGSCYNVTKKIRALSYKDVRQKIRRGYSYESIKNIVVKEY